MTRINWDEVSQLTRLDEIIAYSIITLQEAYTAPNNDDLSSITKADISDWVRWEIAYDDQGRAFFRYAASLYVIDKTPMADRDFLSLINAPTRWLVNHATVSIDSRDGDTALKIDPLTDIPSELVTSMEKLLFWAIVLGDWWNQTLKYIGATELPEIPAATDIPIGNWGSIRVPPVGTALEGEDSSIDALFDAYNGRIDDPELPDFLDDILDDNSNGKGKVKQDIDLPSDKDSGAYRENLVTCAEQDPAIQNFSVKQLEALLLSKSK